MSLVVYLIVKYAGVLIKIHEETTGWPGVRRGAEPRIYADASPCEHPSRLAVALSRACTAEGRNPVRIDPSGIWEGGCEDAEVARPTES
jgi:hypothetical protein